MAYPLQQLLWCEDPDDLTRDSVRVGDKVQVDYKGVATRSGVAYKWVDVDEALYVTQIMRTYNANGSTSATVQVSNVDDLPIDDTTVLYDQASQVGVIARGGVTTKGRF